VNSLYELIYSKDALKFLEKLDGVNKARIISSLERCRIRPEAHAKRLVSLPYFSLRAGKFRLILDLIRNELRIYVIEIGHRKNIYKNL